MFIILAIIVGCLIGLSIGIGTARMFHAPEKQGLGAFRTLGEINSCNGDPVSHFAFGTGFLFSSAAAAVGTGALTQDVIHRIIPNWGIGLANVFIKKKDAFQIMKSPLILGISSMIIGIVVFPLILLIYNYIPQELSLIASGVLSPAATWLFSYIMPVLFLIAAMDAGKKQGLMAIIFGVLSQFISGNAVPGIVLGIIVGSSWAEAGWRSKQFIILFILTIILFILIAYFREITWEKIVTLKSQSKFIDNLQNDLNYLASTSFDVNIFTNSGIVNEV